MVYPLIDCIEFLSSIGGIIIGIILIEWWLIVTSVVFFLIYPIINEMIYNLFTKLAGRREKYDPELKTRLVYCEKYNLSFCGLEKLHPFDSQKYANTVNILQEEGVVSENQFIQPGKISRSMLLEKLSFWHLLKICYSIPLCSWIEMPLFFLPAFLLRWRVLNPMLRATEGTLIACELAYKLKWAINLSGGYHHAYCQQGGGFCVYPDITLAVHYVRKRLGCQKVMIIDLDAHQGNGHQRDHIGDENVFIVDCYNHAIYPNDAKAKKAIGLDIRVSYSTTDQQYLDNLLPVEDQIEKFQPNFIIYNAGTDTLAGDPLGALNLSKQCHVQRDQYIVGLGIKHKIPTVMVLSGGYQKSNAQVIASSITNLMGKFNGRIGISKD